MFSSIAALIAPLRPRHRVRRPHRRRALVHATVRATDSSNAERLEALAPFLNEAIWDEAHRGFHRLEEWLELRKFVTR